MKREEILNMPAGREMDALIAVDVLGWRVDDMTAYSPTGSANSRIHKGGDDWLAHYSTDISAAWEVVEKLGYMAGEQNRFTDRDLGWLSLQDRGGLYVASFYSEIEHVDDWEEKLEDGEYIQFSAMAETAPLAICRAALLAVMEIES